MCESADALTSLQILGRDIIVQYPWQPNDSRLDAPSMITIHEFSGAAVIENLGPLAAMDADLEQEVARLWRAEQTRRGSAGALFDGPILSAVEVAPNRVAGRVGRYRQLIAQRARPELYARLNIRPVAVAGILVCDDGLVFGRRIESVTEAPGQWETVPAGGVDASHVDDRGRIDYRAQILTELEEEVGIPGDEVSAVQPFCLADDTQSRNVEVGIVVRVARNGGDVLAAHEQCASREYMELAVVQPTKVHDFVARLSEPLVEVSEAILNRYLAQPTPR